MVEEGGGGAFSEMNQGIISTFTRQLLPIYLNDLLGGTEFEHVAVMMTMFSTQHGVHPMMRLGYCFYNSLDISEMSTIPIEWPCGPLGP